MDCKLTAYKIVREIQNDIEDRNGMAEDIYPEIWTEIINSWIKKIEDVLTKMLTNFSF